MWKNNSYVDFQTREMMLKIWCRLFGTISLLSLQMLFLCDKEKILLIFQRNFVFLLQFNNWRKMWHRQSALETFFSSFSPTEVNVSIHFHRQNRITQSFVLCFRLSRVSASLFPVIVTWWIPWSIDHNRGVENAIGHTKGSELTDSLTAAVLPLSVSVQ